MGHKLKLDLTGFDDLSVEIRDASTTLDEGLHQCWCVKLDVYWQTMAIKGWAFLSSWWGELMFQKVYDGQPPHLISGNGRAILRSITTRHFRILCMREV